MELGEVIIFIFGQVLWFGNRMDKSLINHNRCQSFGISICYDPINQHSPLATEADFITHTPMSMVVSTCGFITRYPKDDKIETCQQINISNEQNWDPSKHIFRIYSMEEEQRRIVFTLRLINQVIIQTPCDKPVTYIQDDMDIHYFDRAMVNVLIRLAQDLMVDRLMGNIRFSSIKKLYATITMKGTT